MAESGQTRKEQREAARAERARAEAARERQRRRLWQLGGALGLAAAVVVALVLAFGSGGDDATPVRQAGEDLPGQIEANQRFEGIVQKDNVLGDPKAPITLVEYADLQCPFCRQYSLETFPQIVATYVLTGQVRLVFRDVAFLGEDSVRAQRMAAAAGKQNKLWEFVDIFYANQGAENSGYVTDDHLREIASAVDGLDVEQAMKDMDDPEWDQRLADDQAEWQTYGLTGTPSFVMGPTGGTLTPVLGDNESPTLELMTERIDAALQQAK